MYESKAKPSLLFDQEYSLEESCGLHGISLQIVEYLIVENEKTLGTVEMMLRMKWVFEIVLMQKMQSIKWKSHVNEIEKNIEWHQIFQCHPSRSSRYSEIQKLILNNYTPYVHTH